MRRMLDGLLNYIYVILFTCLSRMNGEDENHKKGDHPEEGEA